MSDGKALIGIDWGTHSSKWTWVLLGPDAGEVVGPYKILRSEVCLDNDRQIFLNDEAPPSGSVYVSGVKGKLIDNPDGPFWVGPQRNIRLTLGELASFSFWSLLGQAYDNLCRNEMGRPEELDVRFSLPNWVDTQKVVGRACYEQAAKVACHLFSSDREAWSRAPRPSVDEWQRKVRGVLDFLTLSDDSPIDDSRDGFRLMVNRVLDAGEGFSFRFVAESSAAGLAGLRRASNADSGYLLKILVVDVGAGSTDVGYVIRSVPPRGTAANEVLCQLPPANTCPIAGNNLSRRIVEIYQSQGIEIGMDEAERRKVGGEDNAWQTHPAVTDWIRSISEHVRAYVLGIPDARWLPEMPGLLVLVTGGSGVVSGLREDILSGVAQGLRERRIPASVIDATKPMNLALTGPAAKDANRLAVALGAASEDLPRLSYHNQLDPPMPHSTVRMPRSWTG